MDLLTLSDSDIESIAAALPRAKFDRLTLNPIDAALLRRAFPVVEGVGMAVAGSVGVELVERDIMPLGLCFATRRGQYVGIYRLYAEPS